jgi:hypothetical protein
MLITYFGVIVILNSWINSKEKDKAIRVTGRLGP